MNDVQQRCRTLQDLLHKEVPLSETIGMLVHDYNGKNIELRADLKPNINIHGVAFGGSIYSMCSLAGWGLLILRLQELHLDPRIMIAAADIKYMKPVDQAIRAYSSFYPGQNFEDFLLAYRETNKARIKIPVEIRLDNGDVAAQFTGEYIALKRRG